MTTAQRIANRIEFVIGTLTLFPTRDDADIARSIAHNEAKYADVQFGMITYNFADDSAIIITNSSAVICR